MKINILYDDFGSVKFDTIEVEEKPKTYKTVGNTVPRIYLNTINAFYYLPIILFPLKFEISL